MLSLGVDFGTSGVRAVVLDNKQKIVAQAQSVLPASKPYFSHDNVIIGFSQNSADWWHTFIQVIKQLKSELSDTPYNLSNITHLAIDGTSGTVLLADSNGSSCTESLMYNDQRAIAQAFSIQQVAPPETAASSVTSGLAKLLWLYEHHARPEQVHFALNQSDWISGKLLNRFNFSDHNNALKMGYDALNNCWPEWLLDFLESKQFPQTCLPEVYSPGQAIGTITSDMADLLGFNTDLVICAGTTDSTAAIFASGISEVGEAVTSLGSSIVMKVLSDTPVFDAQYGVYSQPYGQLWLVGGSSNSGGAVLKSFFCPGEISDYTEQLNQAIDENRLSLLNLGYYPLLTPGERFPVNDPNLSAKLEPRPDSDLAFFQGMLEGMADIETMAYQRLLDLGAPYPKRVISMGGGAFNRAWRHIREQKLKVPVLLANQEQAAAGTAILAQSQWTK